MKRPAYLRLVKIPSAPAAAPAVPVYQINSLDALSGEMWTLCSFADHLTSHGILGEGEAQAAVMRWFDEYGDSRQRQHALKAVAQCYGGSYAADVDPDSPTTPFYGEAG